MNATKIFGWALLIAGLAVIGWTLYSSYNIFTGKVEVPEIFKMAEKETALPQENQAQGIQAQMEEKVKEMLGEQLKGIFPTDTLPKILNLIVWSILASILIFGGSQISSLGIKLMKY